LLLSTQGIKSPGIGLNEPLRHTSGFAAARALRKTIRLRKNSVKNFVYEEFALRMFADGTEAGAAVGTKAQGSQHSLLAVGVGLWLGCPV